MWELQCRVYRCRSTEKERYEFQEEKSKVENSFTIAYLHSLLYNSRTGVAIVLLYCWMEWRSRYPQSTVNSNWWMVNVWCNGNALLWLNIVKWSGAVRSAGFSCWENFVWDGTYMWIAYRCHYVSGVWCRNIARNNESVIYSVLSLIVFSVDTESSSRIFRVALTFINDCLDSTGFLFLASRSSKILTLPKCSCL